MVSGRRQYRRVRNGGDVCGGGGRQRGSHPVPRLSLAGLLAAERRELRAVALGRGAALLRRQQLARHSRVGDRNGIASVVLLPAKSGGAER